MLLQHLKDLIEHSFISKKEYNGKNVEEEKVFNKEEVVEWRCRNCGHIHVGTEALEKCPICDYPKGYFEIRADKF